MHLFAFAIKFIWHSWLTPTHPSKPISDFTLCMSSCVLLLMITVLTLRYFLPHYAETLKGSNMSFISEYFANETISKLNIFIWKLSKLRIDLSNIVLLVTGKDITSLFFNFTISEFNKKPDIQKRFNIFLLNKWMKKCKVKKSHFL